MRNPNDHTGTSIQQTNKLVTLFALAPIALGIVLAFSSCATGPDYSPDVVSHAASFGGTVPTFTADGRMAAVQTYGNGNGRRGTNIFD